MTNRLLYLIIIFGFATNIYSQKKSTIFLDTISITSGKSITVLTVINKIYIINDNRDTNILAFENDSLKIYLNFHYNFSYSIFKNIFRKKINIPERNREYFIDPCGVELIANGKSISYLLDTLQFYKVACNLYEFKYIKRNWKNGDLQSDNKKEVIVCYRLTHAFPEDTTNFNFNHRNGIWISYFSKKKTSIQYSNDQRNGKAYVYELNGDYRIYEFNSDNLIGDVKFYNKSGIEKSSGMYIDTELLMNECSPKYKRK